MASTIKISKSKSLTFRKLSFLYLVFILFLFFSSAGQYVYQYPGIATTQAELNSRLSFKLNNTIPANQLEANLKKVTQNSCMIIDGFLKEYEKYVIENNIKGDKLRENHFVEYQIKNGEMGKKLDLAIIEYVVAYKKLSGKDLNELLLNPTDFKNKQYTNSSFYFKDSPNGVIPNIFEYFKTIFLYQTILVFNKESFVDKKTEILNLEQANFIESFEKNLILGETFDINIQSGDTNLIPLVKINNETIPLLTKYKGIYRIIYQPKAAGNYAVEVNMGDKKVLTSFDVVGPSFNFIPKESNLKGEVGKPIIISLSRLSRDKHPSLKYTSENAELVHRNNTLTITPQKEGKFDILMVENGYVIDRLSFFATEPNNPEVALMNISGEKVEFNNAHRLESVNTFWQVINFDMNLITPDGNHSMFHCATRFLRNELRKAEGSAPNGSTIIFDNIKLIGRDGTTTTNANPVVIIK